MVGSIDPRCETVRGTHWPKKVAWLFGARVAETILASGPKSPHQQAGHMDASDPIKPSKKLLWHGGRPHMGPCFRRDDERFVASSPRPSLALPFRQSLEGRQAFRDVMESLLVDRKNRHLRAAIQAGIVERAD